MKGQMIISGTYQKSREVASVLRLGGIQCAEGDSHGTLGRIINSKRAYTSDSVDSGHGALLYAERNGYEIITAERFLSNPEVIHGWKKKEKEYVVTQKILVAMFNEAISKLDEYSKKDVTHECE
jgi:hypothetical protein